MTEKTAAKPQPTPMPKAVLCPYCGAVSRAVQRCDSCGGYLDALSRQATQNGMGPWQVHNPARPFAPGCSFDILCKLVATGRVSEHTVIRGPTTGQFWMLARRVPGVSHLVGWCHSCQAPARPDEYSCRSCGAVFEGERDRQHLGLGPIRPLPGEGSAELIAARASYALPAVPRPIPGAARAAPAGVNGTAHAPAESGRVRVLERRARELHARLMMCMGVIIVLGCALIGVLVLMSLNSSGGGSSGGVTAAGQSLIPLPDAQGDVADAATGEAATQAPAPVAEPIAAEAPAERSFDITMLSWTDAEVEVRAMVDTDSAESLEHGIGLLKLYDEAVGLPGKGRELLDAWTYRLEQLRLNGLP